MQYIHSGLKRLMEIPAGICLEFDNLPSIRVKHRQSSLIGFIRAGVILLYNRTNRTNEYMPFDAGVPLGRDAR